MDRIKTRSMLPKRTARKSFPSVHELELLKDAKKESDADRRASKRTAGKSFSNLVHELESEKHSKKERDRSVEPFTKTTRTAESPKKDVQKAKTSQKSTDRPDHSRKAGENVQPSKKESETAESSSKTAIKPFKIASRSQTRQRNIFSEMAKPSPKATTDRPWQLRKAGENVQPSKKDDEMAKPSLKATEPDQSQKAGENVQPSKKDDEKAKPSQKATEPDQSRKAGENVQPSKKDDEMAKPSQKATEPDQSRKAGENVQSSKKDVEMAKPSQKATEPDQSRKAGENVQPSKKDVEMAKPSQKATEPDQSRKAGENVQSSKKDDEMAKPSQKASDRPDQSRKADENVETSKKNSEKAKPSQKATEPDQFRKTGENVQPSKKDDEKAKPSQKASGRPNQSQKADENVETSKKNDEKARPSQKATEPDQSRKTGENVQPSKKDDEKAKPSQKASDRPDQSRKAGENVQPSKKDDEKAKPSQIATYRPDQSQKTGEILEPSKKNSEMAKPSQTSSEKRDEFKKASEMVELSKKESELAESSKKVSDKMIVELSEKETEDEESSKKDSEKAKPCQTSSERDQFEKASEMVESPKEESETPELSKETIKPFKIAKISQTRKHNVFDELESVNDDAVKSVLEHVNKFRVERAMLDCRIVEASERVNMQEGPVKSRFNVNLMPRPEANTSTAKLLLEALQEERADAVFEAEFTEGLCKFAEVLPREFFENMSIRVGRVDLTYKAPRKITPAVSRNRNSFYSIFTELKRKSDWVSEALFWRIHSRIGEMRPLNQQLAYVAAEIKAKGAESDTIVVRGSTLPAHRELIQKSVVSIVTDVDMLFSALRERLLPDLFTRICSLYNWTRSNDKGDLTVETKNNLQSDEGLADEIHALGNSEVDKLNCKVVDVRDQLAAQKKELLFNLKCRDLKIFPPNLSSQPMEKITKSTSSWNPQKEVAFSEHIGSIQVLVDKLEIELDQNITELKELLPSNLYTRYCNLYSTPVVIDACEVFKPPLNNDPVSEVSGMEVDDDNSKQSETSDETVSDSEFDAILEMEEDINVPALSPSSLVDDEALDLPVSQDDDEGLMSKLNALGNEFVNKRVTKVIKVKEIIVRQKKKLQFNLLCQEFGTFPNDLHMDREYKKRKHSKFAKFAEEKLMKRILAYRVVLIQNKIDKLEAEVSKYVDQLKYLLPTDLYDSFYNLHGGPVVIDSRGSDEFHESLASLACETEVGLQKSNELVKNFVKKPIISEVGLQKSNELGLVKNLVKKPISSEVGRITPSNSEQSEVTKTAQNIRQRVDVQRGTGTIGAHKREVDGINQNKRKRNEFDSHSSQFSATSQQVHNKTNQNRQQNEFNDTRNIRQREWRETMPIHNRNQESKFSDTRNRRQTSESIDTRYSRQFRDAPNSRQINEFSDTRNFHQRREFCNTTPNNYQISDFSQNTRDWYPPSEFSETAADLYSVQPNVGTAGHRNSNFGPTLTRTEPFLNPAGSSTSFPDRTSTKFQPNSRLQRDYEVNSYVGVNEDSLPVESVIPIDINPEEPPPKRRCEPVSEDWLEQIVNQVFTQLGRVERTAEQNSIAQSLPSPEPDRRVPLEKSEKWLRREDISEASVSRVTKMPEYRTGEHYNHSARRSHQPTHKSDDYLYPDQSLTKKQLRSSQQLGIPQPENKSLYSRAPRSESRTNDNFSRTSSARRDFGVQELAHRRDYRTENRDLYSRSLWSRSRSKDP